MEFSHIPVMLEQCMDGLALRPDGVYLDGTVGGAGHSTEIARRLGPDGRLICLDQDPDAIQTATERLRPFPQATVVPSNFRQMAGVLTRLGISKVDGILLDLGVSSHQLDVPERGFSYLSDAPLDMRMSQNGTSAKDLVNGLPQEELVRIFREYGEEPFAVQIARNIVRAREEREIETTGELSELIIKAVPAARRRDKNPCKQVFQAIRIAVNAELDALSEGLDAAFEALDHGGRLAVLTFHSLEDRMVKRRFADWCKGCICPPEFPVCVCHHQPEGKLITKKPIVADEEELSRNKRSASAKLRVIEKI